MILCFLCTVGIFEFDLLLGEEDERLACGIMCDNV